jgi:hypothetical protein
VRVGDAVDFGERRLGDLLYPVAGRAYVVPGEDAQAVVNGLSFGSWLLLVMLMVALRVGFLQWRVLWRFTPGVC